MSDRCRAVFEAMAASGRPVVLVNGGRVEAIRPPARLMEPGSVEWIELMTEGTCCLSLLREVEGRAAGFAYDQLVQWMEIGQIGGWSLDLVNNRLLWSAELYRLFEIDPTRFGASYEAFLDLVHPDDRGLVDTTYQASIVSGKPYLMTHRLRMPDGRVKWIEERGRTFHDDSGRPVRSVGTAADVTDHHELRERLSLRDFVLSSTPVAMAIGSLDGRISSVNPAFVKLWRCATPHEPVGRAMPDFWADPAQVMAITETVIREGFWIGELAAKRADGSEFIAQIVGNRIPDREGRPLGLLGHFIDVTARVKAERLLRQSATSLALVFDNTTDFLMLIEVGPGGELRIQAFNETFRRVLQAVRPEARDQDVIGQDPDVVLHDLGLCGCHEVETGPDCIRRVVETGERLRFRADVSRTGAVLDVLVHPVSEEGGRCTHAVWSARDVTEARRATDFISSQLAEKEVLLREIHHRVKNNLQIVSSLLALQEQTSESAALSEMLTKSRSRIAAMALVHEQLYSSENLAEVDLGAYARSLMSSLGASIGAAEQGIEFSVRGEGFALEIDRAIPSGLVLNELLTNALKHAFPDGRRGVISISFEETPDAHEVRVRDDGVGMSPASPDGLGLLLLPRLVAQIGATLEREPVAGTAMLLRIPRLRPGR